MREVIRFAANVAGLLRSYSLYVFTDSHYKDDTSGRLPRALLSCFGKKVSKEAAQEEALSL